MESITLHSCTTGRRCPFCGFEMCRAQECMFFVQSTASNDYECIMIQMYYLVGATYGQAAWANIIRKPDYQLTAQNLRPEYLQAKIDASSQAILLLKSIQECPCNPPDLEKGLAEILKKLGDYNAFLASGQNLGDKAEKCAKRKKQG